MVVLCVKDEKVTVQVVYLTLPMLKLLLHNYHYRILLDINILSSVSSTLRFITQHSEHREHQAH